MLAGVAGCFCLLPFAHIEPIRGFVRVGVRILPPILIFIQLLLTFSRISFHDMKPRFWMVWLLAIQLSLSLLLMIILYKFPLNDTWHLVLEGFLICILSPTATAAPVITGKLGGNPAALTTYTLLSNLTTAVLAPLCFPLIVVHPLHFSVGCIDILLQVVPLLLFPYLLALLIRWFLPSVHCFMVRNTDFAFYLWAITLVIVMGKTTFAVMNGHLSIYTLLALSAVALFACCMQFLVGRYIGNIYSDKISSGQALGQKNTVLGIWMASVFLNPVVALAPCSYVVWQNIINSWQLWHKQRRS